MWPSSSEPCWTCTSSSVVMITRDKERKMRKHRINTTGNECCIESKEENLWLIYPPSHPGLSLRGRTTKLVPWVHSLKPIDFFLLFPPSSCLILPWFREESTYYVTSFRILGRLFVCLFSLYSRFSFTTGEGEQQRKENRLNHLISFFLMAGELRENRRGEEINGKKNNVTGERERENWVNQWTT